MMPKRVFDPKLRQKMKQARKGQLQGKRRSDMDPQWANYAAGGKLPSHVFKAARKGKTSVPARKRK